MYSNILIISDNIYLSKQFNMIATVEKLKNTNITFSTSSFSNLEDFSKALNVEVLVYDLKKDNIIDEIITRYDLVFSIHCKQLFPEKMVKSIKCINIHPGYNPINRGWYPQVFAIVNEQIIGATIHEIDVKLDHGPIIARTLVEKTVIDTSGSLYDRILETEILLLKQNLASIINNSYTTFMPEIEGELMLKKDFNNLCKLDLEEEMSTKQFIDKLRSLTHGDFKNAYFIDPETKKKVHVSINLELE